MRPIATQFHHPQCVQKSVQSRGVSPRTGPTRPGSVSARQTGFTLIELMIAISILLLLTYITAKVAGSFEADRVGAGARRVQSYLEGARDRAIYSSKTLNPGPRGIRFLRDPNGLKKTVFNSDGSVAKDFNGNPIEVLTTVTSMIYIGPPQLFSEGGIKIGEQRSDGSFDRRKIVPFNTNWRNLALRKFLLNGARIRIPAVHGKFYTMIFNRNDPNPANHHWELTKDYPASKFPRTEYDYELELEPAVLPNQEPRLLPRNVVIDISPIDPTQPLKKHSVIPGFWNKNPNFQNRMDVLFSPQGTVVGRAAVGGYIHLVVTELEDAEEGRFTGDPNKKNIEKIISINTRTGTVTVHSVNPTKANGSGDPFRFAETGEES